MKLIPIETLLRVRGLTGLPTKWVRRKLVDEDLLPKELHTDHCFIYNLIKLAERRLTNKKGTGGNLELPWEKVKCNEVTDLKNEEDYVYLGNLARKILMESSDATQVCSCSICFHQLE